MARIPVDIEPGGMLTDLVENKLGKHQHQEVGNLRQEKIGEWESVPGYKHYFYDGDGDTNPDFTNIKAAVEISDDESGDRFLLVQEGITLTRIDYDIGNSPVFGYENETNSPISLPSGVTIASDAQLRFFYFRGIVRITGASEPIWYGYINRTLFPNSWSEDNLDDFNTGVDGWTGSDATIVQETVSPLLEGVGCLQITATAANGYAYKALTVVSGIKYYFFVKGIKATGQTSDNFKMTIGTTQGGSEITSITKTTTSGVPLEDDWLVFEHTFTATTTTIYIGLTPIDNGDIVHFDYALLRRNHADVIEDWIIFKAQLEKPIAADLSITAKPQGSNINVSGWLYILGALSYGYDKSQFSMFTEDIEFDGSLFTAYLEDTPNNLGGGSIGALKFDLTVSQYFDKYRITSALISLYYSIGEGAILNPGDAQYDVHDEIDFTEEYEDGITFAKSNFHIDTAAQPKRLDLDTAGDPDQRKWDGLFKVGQRIKISGNRISGTPRTVDTIITAVSGAGMTDADHYIEILDDVAQLGVTGDLPEMGVWVEKTWDYSLSTGWTMRSVTEIEGTNQGTFPNVTDIPAGTEDINPNFTHWVVIEEIAYINSREDDERDAWRYSPIYQFDSFSDINIQQVMVGDLDQTKALVKRLNRLVTLKRHSLTQGNFVNGQYYEDISPKDFGLYAINGYKVVGSILYFMDKDDFYMFSGTDPKPLLVNEQMRNIYREYISEDSLVEYDSLNNELILILKGSTGKILVFHPERKEWYIRETDITVLTTFRDYDKRIIYAAANKLVTFNHSYTTFDESIRWYIKTKLLDDETAEYFKKLNKVRVRMKGNKVVTVNSIDPEKGISKTKTFFPNSDKIENNRVEPKFLFNQTEIEIDVEASTTQAATIRHIQLEIEKWK